MIFFLISILCFKNTISRCKISETKREEYYKNHRESINDCLLREPENISDPLGNFPDICCDVVVRDKYPNRDNQSGKEMYDWDQFCEPFKSGVDIRDYINVLDLRYSDVYTPGEIRFTCLVDDEIKEVKEKLPYKKSLSSSLGSPSSSLSSYIQIYKLGLISLLLLY